MIVFLGSSIGNFNPTQCDRFIEEITAALNTGDYTNFNNLGHTCKSNLLRAIATRSGVVKIEISESAATLKKLLKNASTPQEKERIQTIYWLKTKTVKTVKQIAIMLGRNRVTVPKWLSKYRQGGLDVLLESKSNVGGRPTSIRPDIVAKLKEELKNPEGFQSYGEIQQWLKTCFEIDVAYRTVHELVKFVYS